MPVKAPVIRFRLVKDQVEITTTNAVKIFAQNGTMWTTVGDDMVPLRSLNIVGDAEDKGRPYLLNWKFEFTPDEFSYFGMSLGALRKPLSDEGLRGAHEIDIYSEVTPWLTIGFLRRIETNTAYLRFTKEGRTLTASLPDLSALERLREILY